MRINHKKLRAYIALTRLNRPIGILLLLWPTLWALWIAGNGHPPFKLILVFAVGVILMRSAGCVINDYCDRHFDGYVARTRNRPIVTGQVSPREALLVFGLLCLLSAGLLFFLPPLARWLAVAAVAITALYPCAKRITHLPQFILGVAFAWGVPMAFAAQGEHLPWVAWLIFLIAYLWIVAYDTIYAMVDRQDDIQTNIKSTAILWGDKDIWVIGGLHAVMLLLLFLLGICLSLGIYYYLSVLVAAGVMGYQHYLIKDRISARCFKSFLISHWAGCAVFMGILSS